ncbi:hypothetical protein DFH09DRAFT_1245746 [Mycena vulgaris]|nr:hypothetical protein DFH09DRAFT_1245746 [Mycena vulgaris]
MYRHTSFAVFGAGLIGTPIAKELSARGASVLVLARPGCCPATVKQNLPAGIEVVEVEYTDSGAVANLLKRNMVKVVISTMSAAEVDGTKPGVELFAPSEFGVVTEGIYGPKRDEISTIGQSELLWPCICILTTGNFRTPQAGFFIETIPALTGFSVNGKIHNSVYFMWILTPKLGKINVVGYGNMPCSFTASCDVAGFVAHVLTTFRLQGDRSTLSDLAALFGTEVEFVKQIPGKMSEVWTRMQMAAECGVASTGWDMLHWVEGDEYAGCTNNLWEGHEWKTIKTFYRL